MDEPFADDPTSKKLIDRVSALDKKAEHAKKKMVTT